VNPNYVTLNVDFEHNARRSHLKIFKEIVNLRQFEIFRTGDIQFYEIPEYVFAFSRYKIYWMEIHHFRIVGINLILIFRSNKFLRTYFIVINLGSKL